MPETVDYEEWKNSVGELERILDQEDGKFDPKSDIEKEYSNLEKLAQETKVLIVFKHTCTTCSKSVTVVNLVRR